MTQTRESSTRMAPARRRPIAALPVLISIPNLDGAARSPRPRARRRRLRRELRTVGYALLVIFPLSTAWIILVAARRPVEASSRLVERSTDVPEDSGVPTMRVSLAPLEPALVSRREIQAPVFLPGYLLPADAAEEASDGGH